MPSPKQDVQGTPNNVRNNNNENNNGLSETAINVQPHYNTRSSKDITLEEYYTMLQQDNPNSGKDPNLGGPFNDLRRKTGIAIFIDDKQVEQKFIESLKHPERMQQSPIKLTPEKRRGFSERTGKEFRLVKKLKMWMSEPQATELTTYEAVSPAKSSEAKPKISTKYGNFSHTVYEKLKEDAEKNQTHKKIPAKLNDPATFEKNRGPVLFNSKIWMEANKFSNKRDVTQRSVMGISAGEYATKYGFTDLAEGMHWCHDVAAVKMGPICTKSIKETQKHDGIKVEVIYTPVEDQKKEEVDPNKGEVRKAQIPQNLYAAPKAYNANDRILEMFEALLAKLGYEVLTNKNKTMMDFAPHMLRENTYTIEWGKFKINADNGNKEFVRHGKLEQEIDPLNCLAPTCDDYNILTKFLNWLETNSKTLNTSHAKITKSLFNDNLPSSRLVPLPPLLDLTLESKLDNIAPFNEDECSFYFNQPSPNSHELIGDFEEIPVLETEWVNSVSLLITEDEILEPSSDLSKEEKVLDPQDGFDIINLDSPNNRCCPTMKF